jgi:hypothetical protein
MKLFKLIWIVRDGSCEYFKNNWMVFENDDNATQFGTAKEVEDNTGSRPDHVYSDEERQKIRTSLQMKSSVITNLWSLRKLNISKVQMANAMKSVSKRYLLITTKRKESNYERRTIYDCKRKRICSSAMDKVC